MDHYLDITLRPDPEFAPNVLMNALYGKLHRALVQIESHHVGVSFPRINSERPTLGTLLRLHGKASELQQLMALKWLTGMYDHVTASELSPIRTDCRYRVVRRVQAKSNPERLRRRLAMRKGISLEQARETIPDQAAQFLRLPFVCIRSQSTGHTFRMFIEHMSLQPSLTAGEFSYYGLSPVATVPWF